MNIEEQGKIILTSWLNEYNIQVYWEHQNQYKYPTFKTKGTTREKPDLLLQSPSSKQWVAIEVKPVMGSEIRKAKKIIHYLEQAEKKETKYFVDNKEVHPTIFLVATENSKHGYLFEKETHYKTLSATKAELWGVPQTEYNRTHDFYRTLIAEWKTSTKKCSLGVLLGESQIPKIFFKTYNFTKKTWWGHRYWNL